MSETISLEPLLSTEEAAQILKLSPSWLAKARMRGDGPDYIQIGRAIRYSRTGLLQFSAKQTRKTKTENSVRKREGTTD
jgi:hypothetical protein